MVGLPKIGNWCVLLVAVALICAGACEAQDRETNTLSSAATLFRPPTLRVQDLAYRDYFSGADEAIRLSYTDRWRYHETQSSFHQTRNTAVHLDIGAFSQPGIGPQEADVRAEFARAALRMRLEAAFRRFMAKEENKSIRNAHRVLENLKSQSFKTSNDAESGEIRFGWDVVTDRSRLEYVKGTIGAGFYHSAFSGIPGGGRRLTEPLSFNSWKNFGPGKPSANLGYVFSGKLITAGLTKAFSPVVTGELLATQPSVNNGAPSSVLMRMIYRF